MSASYCTSCGASRGATAFCTSCGERHQDRATSAADPNAVARAAPKVRSLRCVDCGSVIESGLACARCASKSAPSQSAVPAGFIPPSPAPPRTPTPVQSPSSATPSLSGTGRRWVAVSACWASVALVGLVWMNQKTHGRLGRDASASIGGLSSAVANGGLDGTYVCSDGPVPTAMTIRIQGATGDMDLGVASARGMRVERHGDTVSMSGGQAYDAQGQPVDAQTRAEMVGGNDVDLLTVGDDGQSLTLDLGEGRRARFVKQP